MLNHGRRTAKIKDYGVDGVLVGRAVCGNPWFFLKRANCKEKLKAAIEHCKYFAKLNHLSFVIFANILGWYCKGFDGAKELRVKLMRAENAQEVERDKKNFTLGFRIKYFDLKS